MFSVSPRTDTLLSLSQLGDTTALDIPMERGAILGRDDRVELSRFSFRQAARPKVELCELGSNSIGVTGAIGEGEGAWKAERENRGCSLSGFSDDLPLLHVAPAGFDGNKPAVIDQDLGQVQGGLPVPDGVGAEAYRYPARIRWVCPIRVRSQSRSFFARRSPGSAQLDPEIRFASAA